MIDPFGPDAQEQLDPAELLHETEELLGKLKTTSDQLIEQMGAIADRMNSLSAQSLGDRVL